MTEVHKISAYMPVSGEILGDTGDLARAVSAWLDESMRRMLYPWEFADPPAIGTIEMFPRLAAARARIDRTRRTAAVVLHNLRHLTEQRPDPWEDA